MRHRRVVFLALLLTMVACSPGGGGGGERKPAGAGGDRDATSEGARTLTLLEGWKWPAPQGASAGMPGVAGTDAAVTYARSRLVLLDRAGKVRWDAERIGLREVAPALTPDLVLAATETGLVAYDRANGRPKWEASLGDRTNTPVVAGNRAVVTTWEGLLAAVDVADGRVAWRLRLGGEALGPAAVSGSTAVATFDTGRAAGVVAVDVPSGRERWSVPLPPDGVSAPAVAAGGGNGAGVVVVVAADLAVHGLAVDDGHELWRQPVEGAGSPEVPPQALDDGRVLVGHRQGGMAVMAASDGAVAWDASSDGAAVRGGPVGPGPNGWFVLPLDDGRLLFAGPDREPDVREPPGLVSGVAGRDDGVLLVGTAQGDDNAVTALTGW